MKTPILTLALSLLIFTGCNGPGWIKSSKMNHLEIGMTKAEVLKLMGEPNSSEAAEGVSKIWYLHDEGGYKHQPYYVEFKEGKVSAYGRGENSVAAPGGGGPGPIIFTPIPR